MEKLIFWFLPNIHSKINRVIKMAAKREVIIPIIKVVANPKIGPLPKMYKINPVKKVVMFESRIEDIAFLNPSAIANLKLFPVAISSRTRS